MVCTASLATALALVVAFLQPFLVHSKYYAAKKQQADPYAWYGHWDTKLTYEERRKQQIVKDREKNWRKHLNYRCGEGPEDRSLSPGQWDHCQDCKGLESVLVYHKDFFMGEGATICMSREEYMEHDEQYEGRLMTHEEAEMEIDEDEAFFDEE